MRILLIRHGEPDYAHDSLTPAGDREAQALADYADVLQPGDIYVSPMGRAKRTAAPLLEKLGKTAEVLPWAEEFHAYLDMKEHPDMWEAYGEPPVGRFSKRIVWDLLPSWYHRHPELMDRTGWQDSVFARYTDIIPRYGWVTGEFDRLLSRYGYVRDGFGYRVERESTQTVTIFCHMGVTCVFLSHLLNCSPFVLWQGSVNVPTAVTEIFSEERVQGLAVFRMRQYGSIAHLTAAGVEPSLAARFTEVFSDKTARH